MSKSVKLLVATAACSALLMTSTSLAMALETTDDGLPGSPMPTKRIVTNENQTQAKEKAEQAKVDARKKVCENRKESVEKIMDKLKTNGDKRLAVITKVSSNVQAFVTKKSFSVPNYDTLLATVNAKKEAAQLAINNTQAAKDSFTCSSDKPGSLVTGFKDKHKAQNQALKAYKDSVKALLAAVKTASQSTGGNTHEDQ